MLRRRRLLTLALAFGSVAALPRMGRAASPLDDAERRAAALRAAGIGTLGQLATARMSELAPILGRSQGRRSRSAARRHVGNRGVLADATPLDALFLVDPILIVNPIWRGDDATQARLAAAKTERSALAAAGIATYAELARAAVGPIESVVGRRRARAMKATVAALERNIRRGVLHADYIDRRIGKGFVADPNLAPDSMHPVPGAAPLPSPHPEPR